MGVLEGRHGADLRSVVCNVAARSDSFVARDLLHVVQRSLVASSRKGNNAISVEPQSLAIVSDRYIPRSRLGLSFDQLEHAGTPALWDEIGGLRDAKSELREAFEFPARFPRLFAEAPVRLQTGALLYGPPGCGKTMLATTAARACGMRSICVKGPELLSKYVGESEAEVRRLFERASSLSPCVIIFDEFDSLAPRRGGETTGVADRVVNTLLTSLDGVEGLAKGVFVIATSSHPELIDPAVLRPGRVDRWIAIDFPSDDERREIIQCLWKGLNVEIGHLPHVGLDDLVVASDGMTGADIRGGLFDAYVACDRNSIELDVVLKSLRSARRSVSMLERKRYRMVMDYFARKGFRRGVEDSLGVKHSVRVALA